MPNLAYYIYTLLIRHESYCNVFGVPWLIIAGMDWILGFINTLSYNLFLITINYSAIANLPTSQITRTYSILVLVLRCTPCTLLFFYSSTFNSAQLPNWTLNYCYYQVQLNVCNAVPKDYLRNPKYMLKMISEFISYITYFLSQIRLNVMILTFIRLSWCYKHKSLKHFWCTI
jgi:hypothetical protein